MKYLTGALAALFLSSTAALAGSPAPAPTPEVIAPAALNNWAGVYGGLSYSNSDSDHVNSGGTTPFGGASGPGAFVGYNWQRGNLVFGGELAYQQDLGVRDTPILAEYPAAVLKGEEFLSDAIDLRARLGYDLGRVMVYGLLGYSQVTFNISDQTPSLDGPVLGAGAALRVSDRVFAGVEATRHDLSGEVFGLRSTYEATTVSLRVGLQF